MDTSAFLRRIGLRKHDGPSVEALFALHAAFATSVPYETVQYQFGHGGPLDPIESAQRIINRQAGGYCFQLNGAFSALLTALGYEVTLHRGGAQRTSAPPNATTCGAARSPSTRTSSPARQSKRSRNPPNAELVRT